MVVNKLAKGRLVAATGWLTAIDKRAIDTSQATKEYVAGQSITT
jgi:hypothetical protein